MQPSTPTTPRTGLSDSGIAGVTSPLFYCPFDQNPPSVTEPGQLTGRFVYLIVNLEGKACYVGKSSNLSNRISSHRAEARLKTPRTVYEEISGNPKAFKWGTVYCEKEDEECLTCAEVEREVIAFMRETGFTLLNSDNGGGGGTGYPACASALGAAAERADFASPEKAYPVTRRNQKFHVFLTPGVKETLRKAREEDLEVIYQFKIKNTRYVGKTNDGVRRLGEWLHAANKKEDKPLAKYLNHTASGTCLFSIQTVVKAQEHGGAVERAVIAAKRNLGPTLNRDNGGGGSLGENVAKRYKMRAGSSKENIKNQPALSSKEETE